MTIANVCGKLTRKRLRLRGIYLDGHSHNAVLVSARNRTLLNKLKILRSTVPSFPCAVFFELGYYILLWLMMRQWEPLDLFLRFGKYESIADFLAQERDDLR